MLNSYNLTLNNKYVILNLHETKMFDSIRQGLGSVRYERNV